MSSTTSTSSGGGIGFAGLLTIVFITLKLTGVIDWSWWWVLSPLWISALLGIAIVVLVLTAAVGWTTYKHFRDKKSERERLARIRALKETGQ